MFALGTLLVSTVPSTRCSRTPPWPTLPQTLQQPGLRDALVRHDSPLKSASHTLPSYEQLVFVHLYSGYRREGDLQAWLETLDWSPKLRPIVVSVDIIVDRDTCNILDPGHRLRWFQFSQRGLIHGIMVGPPCETWSVARERFHETLSGPRPLRQRDLPWLKDGLTYQEAKQVYVANLLLMFAILMMISQWLYMPGTTACSTYYLGNSDTEAAVPTSGIPDPTALSRIL